jgi:phage gp36-like protein
MAMYATQDRMERMFAVEELVRLTGGPPNSTDPADIDTGVLEQAFEDAQDEVDPYLDGQYDLPIAQDDIPGALEMHACALAYFYLHDAPTEQAQARYDRAINFLEDVQKGVRSLGIDDEGETPTDTGGVESTGSQPSHRKHYGYPTSSSWKNASSF